VDRHTQSRLKREQVIWLVTTGRDLKPQAVPVWFHWDGRSFLIYATPGRKVRDVRESPDVELHLNSDEAGDDVVRASGQAKILKSGRPSPGYTRKYRSAIKDLGLTVDAFFRDYSNPIRVTRLRFH
jgi:PPOX class probable F420-dependent enzyme